MVLGYIRYYWKKFKYRDLPEVQEVVLAPQTYLKSDFSEGVLNEVKETYRSFLKAEEGNYVSYTHPGMDTTVYFKIESQKPEEGKPGDYTDVTIVNHVFYEEGKESFDVPEDKLIEVEEKGDLSEKTEVSTAESFANILDQNYGENVFHQPDGNIWISGDYWFQFEE